MPLLLMKEVSKIYPGTIALDKASIKLEKGQVLGMLGLNGAGKSTLMKILSGDITADEGEIYIEDSPITIKNPKDAIEQGIATVYQESQLVEQMTVYENVLLGRECLLHGGVDFSTMQKLVKDEIEKFGFQIPVKAKVSELSTAQKRLVEIVKALSTKAQVMSLDEPTASLTKEEAFHLMSDIKKIKEQGVGIIFVSHRMDEVKFICDCATVLRNGKVVANLEKDEFTEKNIIMHLIGEKADQKEKEREKEQDNAEARIHRDTVALHFKGSLKNKLDNIDFAVYQGEIVGIAGTLGSGRSSLLRAIGGALGYAEYEVLGKKVVVHSVRDAIKEKVIYLPEDRKAEGLFLKWSIKQNISLPYLYEKTKCFISSKWEKDEGNKYIDKFLIKANNCEQTGNELSGGNQQKVLLGKWVRDDAKILMFDEPTHGVDIHAKQEIYSIIRNAAKNGAGVIVVSSELDELIELSVRIIMINNGQIVGEKTQKPFNDQEILSAIS